MKVFKDGDRLLLEPISKEASLLETLALFQPLDEEFPDVDNGLGKLDDIKL